MNGADFGFIGQAYEATALLQDAQRCINWYPEISQDRSSKTPIALLGCPGLNPVLSAPISGPVRGAWVLPGGLQALIVVSNIVYQIDTSVQIPLPQSTLVQVGTLLTSTGRVTIRDNGTPVGQAGGYAVLVDGLYGYYYSLTGSPRISTFTGGVSNGSAVLTPAGGLNNYLVPGSVVSDASNAIPAGTTIVSLNFNAGTILLSAIATNTVASETITVTTPSFARITDPAFTSASRVCFIEGWLIFNQVATRNFYTNAPIPYTLSLAGSFYALRDSSSDNLVTMFENNRELWLIGERTTEVWYNAGGANFAFARLPGIGPQIGCAAANSIARMGTSLVWLAQNEQGESMVIATQQYSWERISTHAIEHAIASYPIRYDAIGDVYQEEGHLFYMLTFPTQDVTWVFDANTRLWHQRASYDPNVGAFHRHRCNVYFDFAGVRLVGDYQTGQIHQMSRNYFTDAGNPLKCQRRAPHIWSRENRKRVFQSSLQIEFMPGVGLQSGQGSSPQAMLRWSNDGAQSWSGEHWANIGAAGNTLNRAIWRRLGKARDRVYELNYTDPTQRDLIGASLFGEGEDDAA